ncbi:hypothetical protein EI94DRAFT_1727747 [Lactarius quietus]|nr:hypothetical protein EI94DRAFT_1727747 [Lactarius quietus]
MLGKFTALHTSRGVGNPNLRQRPNIPKALLYLLTLCAVTFAVTVYWNGHTVDAREAPQLIPLDDQEILLRKASLRVESGPPSKLADRLVFDRFAEGTTATLIGNTIISTEQKNGTKGLLLGKEMVKAIGQLNWTPLRDVRAVDVGGALEIPVLIETRTHVGIYNLPTFHGTFNLNLKRGPILPWLRAIDAYDDVIELVMSGLVASIPVLPAGANRIAGQTLMLKSRVAAGPEPAPMNSNIEPPQEIRGSHTSMSDPPQWQYLNQAFGKNINIVRRVGTLWACLQTYEKASEIKATQDVYCAKAEEGLWSTLDCKFQESSQYEAVVGVFRGRVKVSQHGYETLDIDVIASLSNGLKPHGDVIHHAVEAELVPGVLRWGRPPAINLFSDYHHNKRESDWGSVDAPRVLADNNFTVILKVRTFHSKPVFFGTVEAHLLVTKEIGKVRVGVTLTLPRPLPETWDDRRILLGPPILNDTALVTLLANPAVVGVGTADAGLSAHTRFDLAWDTAGSSRRVSPKRAIGLARVNIDHLLGIDQVFQGGST